MLFGLFKNYKIIEFEYMGKTYFLSLVKRNKNMYMIHNDIPDLETVILTDDKVTLMKIHKDTDLNAQLYEEQYYEHFLDADSIRIYSSRVRQFTVRNFETAKQKIEFHKKLHKKFNRIPKVKSVKYF